MDSPDRQRDAASRIIGILRRVTRVAQLAPFVYLTFYSVYLIIGCFSSDALVSLADGVMFSSPLVTTGMLVLSRMLKLCKWHRTAILIPFSSQIEAYVDSFVFTFTENEIVLINVALGVSAFVFLLMANKHFFHNGRKGNSIRDPRLLQVQG